MNRLLIIAVALGCVAAQAYGEERASPAIRSGRPIRRRTAPSRNRRKSPASLSRAGTRITTTTTKTCRT